MAIVSDMKTDLFRCEIAKVLGSNISQDVTGACARFIYRQSLRRRPALSWTGSPARQSPGGRHVLVNRALRQDAPRLSFPAGHPPLARPLSPSYPLASKAAGQAPRWPSGMGLCPCLAHRCAPKIQQPGFENFKRHRAREMIALPCANVPSLSTGVAAISASSTPSATTDRPRSRYCAV